MALFAKTLAAVRSIRSTIAQAIAPSTIIAPETKQDHDDEVKFITNLRKKQYAEVGHFDHRGQPVVNRARGYFTSDDVAELKSPLSRNAVANSACWWVQLKVINAVKAGKVADAMKAANEWATWQNAANIDQTDAWLDRLEVSVAKQMGGRPPRNGSDASDKILADIRGVSVEELRAKRLAKYEQAVQDAEAHRQTVLDCLLGAQPDGHTYAFKAELAVDAIEKAAMRVAGWDGDADELAATVLIIAGDFTHAAKLNIERHDEQFVEGVMCADTIDKRYDNPDRDAELRTDDDADEQDETPRRRRIRAVQPEELALDPLEILIQREQAA